MSPVSAMGAGPSAPPNMPGRTAKEMLGKAKTQGAIGSTRAQKRRQLAPSRSKRRSGAAGLVREPDSAAPGAAAERAPAAVAATVSATGRARSSAKASTAACTTNGAMVGAGANWASAPVTSGPEPKPADSATAARRAETAGATSRDSSKSQTEPGLVTAPAARP